MRKLFRAISLRNLNLWILTFSILTLAGCTESEYVPEEVAKGSLVINELMPTNRTGIMTEDGKTKEWIEIKNTTENDISLKGFSLMGEWEFPDVTIRGGECVVVFLSKKGKASPSTVNGQQSTEASGSTSTLSSTSFLYADVKLKKEGECVQLIAPNDSIMDEVSYEDVNPDQCVRRLDDGSYEKSYMQTPGFNNDKDGYEAYCKLIEKQRKSPLLIWEVMSRTGRKMNWVELKNVSSDSVDLSEYSLTSKAKNKGEIWSMPEVVLPPNEICVVTLSGKQPTVRSLQQKDKDYVAKQQSTKTKKTGKMEASIKMSNSETVMLLKGEKFVDGVCAKPTIKGISIGRVEGRDGFFYFNAPSKGQENKSAARRFIASMPKADYSSGIYDKTEKLSIHLNAEGRTIHYTLDGSEPDGNAPTYKDAIVITKSTVLRAYCEGDSVSTRSGVMTATYILDAPHDIPVICVAVKPSDMYDFHTGIYADGPGYTATWPHTGANYYHSWEKAANVEFLVNGQQSTVNSQRSTVNGQQSTESTTTINENEDRNYRTEFQTDCGLKIFGGLSRCEAKKSFCLKFKSEYGNSQMEYDFFDKGEKMELKDLVLRAGGQDWNRCMIRDEFFTSLMAENSPALLIQAYRPVALYINAEYFGLYFMRERVNKHFVARHLNVSSDSVTIITSNMYKEEGEWTEYRQLMSYLSTHDMSNKECYEYAKERIDLEGLIDYKLGEIYSANTDIGNTRIVRSADKEGDRKWHFVFYDLDATWIGHRPASKYLRMGGSDPVMGNTTVQNKMIDLLLRNAEFKELMKKRIDHHFAHTFTTENTTKVFDKLVGEIKSEMKRNCERWPQLKYNTWENNIQKFREKFDTRDEVVLKDLEKELGMK